MKLLLNPKTYTGKFTVKHLKPTEGVQKVGGFSRGLHQAKKYLPKWINKFANSVRLGIRNEVTPGTNKSRYPLYLYTHINGEQLTERITVEGAIIGDVVEYELRWGKTSVSAYIDIRRDGELIEIIHNSTFIKKENKWTLPIGYLSLIHI